MKDIPTSGDTSSIDPSCENLESKTASGWSEHMEGVLSGISHHLGNKVAVFSGITDILSREEPVSPLIRVLGDEIPQLEEGISLLRLMVVEEGIMGEEPYVLDDLVKKAVILASMHHEMQAVVTHETECGPPVVGHFPRLIRELTALLISQGKGVSCLKVYCTEEDGKVGVVAGEETLWLKALASTGV